MLDRVISAGVVADVRSGALKQCVVPTRLGRVVVTTSKRGVVELSLLPPRTKLPVDQTSLVARQLRAYAMGWLRRFRVRLDWQRGTVFQRRVWRILQTIPFGQTRTYTWVARRVGKPRAARAVGQACGVNPTPVIVPCHRVVAADGSWGGFAAGLVWKRRLLQHEQAVCAASTKVAGAKKPVNES